MTIIVVPGADQRLKASMADSAVKLFGEEVIWKKILVGPQSSGLGGGLLMTIYIKNRNLVECMDAREVAPEQATEKMFAENLSNSSPVGGLSIAVPGELKGLWELHKRHGKLPWSETLKPAIQLCRKGIEVTDYLTTIFKMKEKEIRDNPSLSKIFINEATKELWKTGDRMKRLNLAHTLEIIGKEFSL